MKFIIWSGFIGSGSSAVGDYLKEFSHTFECGKEIRFIKDPGGISDLKLHLIDHWDFVNSLFAGQQFLKMSKIWARYGNSPFSRPGLSYNKHINKNYYNLSKDYLSSLSLCTLKQEFYCTKFCKPYFKYVFDRNRAYIERKTKGIIKIANRRIPKSYLCNPNLESFSKSTKEYICNLFSPHQFSNGIENTILLDLAISPCDLTPLDLYFDDAKMIIVERDPRDIYVEDVEEACNMNEKVGSYEDGLVFAERMRCMYSKVVRNNPKVLFIRFEDFVVNYEENAKIINKFVNFDEINHVSKNKYFNPSYSIRNVGKWKKYYPQFKDALDVIKEKLPDLCYDK